MFFIAFKCTTPGCSFYSRSSMLAERHDEIDGHETTDYPELRESGTKENDR